MIWLIGSGYMGIEYAKVLEGLEEEYTVIGRGKKSAESFQHIIGKEVCFGGLDTFLASAPDPADYAIIAVGAENLASTTILLLNYGIKNILLEKPGALSFDDISDVAETADRNDANVSIAYNRRFYASVLKALEYIETDGGVTSFMFEFTEWSHKIGDILKAPGVKENWFIGNSTHVVDLAFYLGGRPKEMSCYVSGIGNLPWHPKAAVFSGAGISEKKALFNYQANWEAPGRWGVEVCTRNRRLIFRPLEKLQVQEIGSITIDYDETVDYSLDERFKPGLFVQVQKFLQGIELKKVKEQVRDFTIYTSMLEGVC